MISSRFNFKLSLPPSSQKVMEELDLMLEHHGVRLPYMWNEDMLMRASTMSATEYQLHVNYILRFYQERDAQRLKEHGELDAAMKSAWVEMMNPPYTNKYPN